MRRSSILAPYRLVIGGVVLLLAALTFLFLRGPAFVQRYYYPLEHAEAIEASAVRHKVSPYLIAAIIDSESGWDASTRSSAGAVGLMQVMPSTAEELRANEVVAPGLAAGDLSDPDVNIEYGTAYVRYLVERYHEVETALAAYNAGIANVDVWVEGGQDIRDE
ncbi:MAG: lytic transglycosylase domain-containing protein, partial [Coriobacteriia bacterium]|nr:lytic transglycosylase domain-containing protein [Coriobacteriia bacterium]